jgi:two-component system alkaline phosphatase synthesis response regulator PhoP
MQSQQSQDHKLLVLIVEDDIDQADILMRYLSKDFDVDMVHSYTEAKQKLEQQAPAFIVLDIMLGDDKDAGFRLCHEIRNAHKGGPLSHLTEVMILMLTERQEAPRGLNGGADDYLCKPFPREEFVARVHALRRRMRTGPRHRKLELPPLAIDTSLEIVQVDGKPLSLTNQEYLVLYRLMLENGNTVSRSDILGAGIRSRTVDQTVYTLRQKLKAAYTGADRMVQTVHGRNISRHDAEEEGERRGGYRIVPLR